MRRALLVAGLLLLGLQVKVYGDGVDARSQGWELDANLPGIAVGIYAILLVIVLDRTLDQMPGVFALRRPFGPVDSGYGYLWGAVLISALTRFVWRNTLPPLEGERTRHIEIRYGGAADGWWHTIAVVLLALLLLALKWRAAMIKANRRLATPLDG